MGRRINDGDLTGMKQDKFRNSRFEYENRDTTHFGGVSRKTANTIGGVYQENRGRRSADPDSRNRWESSPFENGGEYNWNKRQGWDEYYNHNYDRGNRNRGGALIGPDRGNNQGRGPRGYRRSDDSIYHDVCDRLSMSPDLDATNIEVSVKEGVVFLRGNVSDRNSKKIAEYEIEHVSGVTDVQNLLDFKRDQGLH